MEQIIVTPKTEQEYSLVMAMLRKMKIEAKASSGSQSLRRMTVEEYRDMAEESIVDVQAGRTVSHQEVKKRIASWR